MRALRDTILISLPLLFGSVAGCTADTDEPSIGGVFPEEARHRAGAPCGEIAYVSQASGNFDIWVTRIGGTPVNLTNDPRDDFQPVWSPDRTRIVFSRVEADGTQHLWIMRADGSDAHMLSDLNAGDPSWSPDGRHLAFDTFPTDYSTFDVGVMRADGGEVTILTDDGVSSTPSWSPDGREIAFMSARNRVATDAMDDLFAMRPDGSNARLVLSLPDDSVFSPSWSPDGRRLVFNKLVAPGLFLVDRDGQHLQQIPNTDTDMTAVFSPDGEWLAYVHTIAPDYTNTAIYFIRTDGMDKQALDASPVLEFTPSWR
jgi:TolB protein